MRLFYTPGTSALAAHIVLIEAGLPYQLEQVDLATRQYGGGQDFTVLNPLGYVPLLELDNGELLRESAAILQFIGDHAPQAGLVPAAGTLSRYRLQEWLSFLISEVHDLLGPFYNPEVPQKSRDLVWARLQPRLAELQRVLSARDYLLRDYGVADALLFSLLGGIEYLKLDVSAYPALAAFRARVFARPATQQALREEGLLPA